jgi:WD40 repeat protein
MIASASMDKTICVWDANTYQCIGVLNGHTDLVYNCAFSADNEKLVSSSPDGTVLLWDVPTQQSTLLCQGQHTNYFRAASFFPDGRSVIVGDDRGKVSKITLPAFLNDLALKSA